jgi:4-hydroxybenzoate polyprenyltransferase
MRKALWWCHPLIVFVVAALMGYRFGLFWIVVALLIGYGIGQLAAIVRVHRASKTWPDEIRAFFKMRHC